ncbi:MAG: MFS transporter, partial [Planctomycetota bacterium]
LVSLIPKSPRWLMMVGRDSEATEAMAQLMSREDIPGEIAAIRESMSNSDRVGSARGQLRELLSRHSRKAVVIGVTIAAVQPITGINAINTYAPMIFAQTGAEDPLWQTALLGVVSLVAIVFSFLLIDRFGRRPIVLFGLFWCVASLVICAWSFQQASYSLTGDSIAEIKDQLADEHPGVADALVGQDGVVYQSDISFMQQMQQLLGTEVANKNKDFIIGEAADIDGDLVLTAMLSFMAAFQFSIGPVMWVVLAEIFPIQLRGIAIPAAQLVTAVVNYFVQQFFPWQLSNMGARDIFLFYAVCVSIGAVALSMLLPETKNKSIEEIEIELSRSKETLV